MDRMRERRLYGLWVVRVLIVLIVQDTWSRYKNSGPVEGCSKATDPMDHVVCTMYGRMDVCGHVRNRTLSAGQTM